ncbi:DUF3261 domain-containing protein [Archangium lipolyticum]|uniref:DUF3261 domain-containing protein n=1 Tax=Archangium lipolyticum TaxID=2970465 RepID=UPI00214A80D9|nr:DUF3261 domain-containing protein [Archangium lipolyticum]
MRRLIAAAALLALTACAARPTRPAAREEALPELRLPPAGLGQPVSLTQQLTFEHARDAGGARSLEALLEVDAEQLRLAGFALGQRVFTLLWDGQHLEEQRAPFVPSQLQAARVLRDIQLVYWPAEGVRAALPPGWTLEDSPGSRALLYAGQKKVVVRYDGHPRWEGGAELRNEAEHYRLSIQSRRNPDE